MGEVGRSDAGELTSVDHRRSAPPPCSIPSRCHPLLPVRATPCRRPLPQRSATPLPTAGARWRHAAGNLLATPSTTSEAATLPFLAAPARILGELRRLLGSIKHQVKPHIFIAWNATLHFSYPQKIEKVLNKFRPGFSNND